jgi:hypothetical protein
MQEASVDMGREIEKMMEPSLMRLAKGLPRHELKIIVREAKECESALLKEIKILEEALGMKKALSTQKESSTSSKDEGANKEISSDAKKSMSAPEAVGSTNNAQATPSSTAASIYGFTGPSYFTTVDAMLQSGLTPPDRYFSVSALFGRLQEPLKLSYADSIGDSKTKSNDNEAVDPKHETKRKETKKLLDKQKVGYEPFIGSTE